MSELLRPPEGRREPTRERESGTTVRRESVLQRRLTLAQMLDVPSFTEVVRGFVELYKIGIKVFDERGDKLADVKIGTGDFCGYVFSTPDGRRGCTANVARIKDGPLSPGQGRTEIEVGGEGPPAQIISVPCFTGLRYLAMPVTWEGDSLGRIIFGPFIPEDLEDLPASLFELSPELDPEKARSLMAKVRRAPEGTVARVMRHFATIMETMVAAGQKTYLTTQLHVEATLDANRELEVQNHQLAALNARLKELDRLKSSFLATVSHELRTPLTSIIGYSEMLAEGLAGPMNQEQVDYVRTIMDKGETLLKLISSILDISQIEAGKVRLNFEPIQLVDVVHSSVSSVRPQAQKKGVSLQVVVPDRALPKVAADHDRLRQVVVNLLANAVKFTPKGGRVAVFVTEIGYEAELGLEGYRVIVEDSGVGIPADQLEKIFQSFYQVDSSSTREYGGAGLGLAIVKSFVEGHGGKVRVASEPGRGSRFVAILPTLPPSPQATVQLGAPEGPEIPDRF